MCCLFSVPMLSSSCLDVGLEVVLDPAVDLLQVAAAARAGATALDGLDGPVVAAPARTWIGAGRTALPLHVVRVTAAAAAEDVGAPVALAHRCGTLRHLCVWPST
ncbi:uncharacterized protein Tco025E_02727 [Trypanosoma conorhini]|uniref:Uncharacterized protein n=1 Tax=Trypanosoma conorhini TaxID=83891 RepID=A0A422Q1K3_9TRYP|nr:uncharacterized protein Tco025E_02727 [Trypanosoma conorhini]RNF23767.1 hypothetical protein Tco025E_02727 [Trypanosoma conorhini]